MKVINKVLRKGDLAVFRQIEQLQVTVEFFKIGKSTFFSTKCWRSRIENSDGIHNSLVMDARNTRIVGKRMRAINVKPKRRA